MQYVVRDGDMTNLPDTEKRGIALAFADLSMTIGRLINDGMPTFLRRCVRYGLGEIGAPDVKSAYIGTVNSSGKKMQRGATNL